MNVIRLENAKVRPVPRGRGRGKGRDQRLYKPHIEEPISSSAYMPKYQSSSSVQRRPLFNGISTSSSVKTPANARRVPRMPSSSSARLRSSASTNLHPTTSTSATADSTVIMAITSGRGDARCEVGMAAIDVKFPHLILSQISDSQTYANTLMKIHFFNPVEIIMPETMCGENDSRKKLFNTVKSKFEGIHITPISRMHFNEENGLDRIKTLCAYEFSTIELFVKEKYYGLSATAALLKYVEFIQHIVYEPKSMKIEFQASQGATLIDVESALSLELVSSQGPQKNHSLLSSLDRCVTPMGRRLLRSSILQPPCDDVVIKERQACVSELVRNRNLHTILQSIVKQLYGADRLLGLSMQTVFISECVEAAERSLNYILLLKTSLEIIPQLFSALETVTSPNFVKIRENLKDPRFQEMKDQILEIIQSDARSVNGYTSANMQRCFALKSGINDMLDVARQTYCELIEQTRILVESLSEEHNLPLTVACNASLGFHIQMDMPKRSSFNINDLPSVFMEIQKKRNSLYMTTDLLMALSQQCNDARDELHIMSNCILEALISTLRKNVACLFQLSEDIAQLDLMMSLARISAIPDYVQPNFGQNLRIIDSKHPILDILGTELPRTNDVQASIPYSFHNITGPNMSGKTTYLKQVVLLHIMAQIGCYVPATEAKIRIVDRIFCRLCPSHEDIESNTSAFIQEIKEIEYILQFVSPKSLIVLDEICRSTNAEEGSAIAFAICEKLLQTTAFVFNCTHFFYLTKLTELYHNFVNHYLECVPNELDKWGLKYTHKLRNGVACVENYGISAATAARMPKPVIEKAKQLVKETAKDFKPLPLVRAPELSWQKDCYACISTIMDLIMSNEYTPVNIQLAVEPLRGHKNLQFFQKENLPPSNTLQKNFEEGASDALQKTLNFIQTQTATNVFQNNARASNIIQYSTEVSNCRENNIVSNSLQNNLGAHPLQSNSEDLNVQKMNVEASNLLRRNTGAFSVHQISVNASSILQSNTGPLNLHQINSLESNLLQSNMVPLNINQIGSNLNSCQFNLHQRQDQTQRQSQHQFQKESQHPSQHQSQQSYLHQIPHSKYESIQQNIPSQKPEPNSSFKIPIAIRPTSIYHVNLQKVKQNQTRERIQTPDISSFAFFKEVQKLRPLNRSLSGMQNSSLYEFGFSKEIVDSKKRSSDSKDFQMSDVQDENDKSVTILISSETQTSNSASSMKETNSNLSHSNLNASRNSVQKEIENRSNFFKRKWQHDQDANHQRSQSQSLSHSNLNDSRHTLQREIESRSISSKRSKLDSSSVNMEVSLNLTDRKLQDSLSSFSTANLSFSLGWSKPPSQNPKSFGASSQNKEKSLSLRRSQDKPASQKSKNFSPLFSRKEESNDLLKKKKDLEVIISRENSISEFESIMDVNTLRTDSISEFPSPKQETKNSDVVTISSDDTIEAAKSARRKEGEIFNQIENANDERMFFQRMFNSPLSMEFSDELCSCSYESSLKS